MTRARLYREAVRRLRKHYGPSGWWPGETPFEVMIGAILTQNTAWTNVERAIAALAGADLLTPAGIAGCPRDHLARLIRPSGYYNQKAARLRDFARWLLDRCDGRLGRLRRVPTAELREELLALKGIGPETADSMLCYALGRPVFVVDAYTHRIWERHGLHDVAGDYAALQREVEAGIAGDRATYADLHGHLVFVGKDCCRKAAPRCAGCPLRGWNERP